jgi:hypothetical protein
MEEKPLQGPVAKGGAPPEPRIPASVNRADVKRWSLSGFDEIKAGAPVFCLSRFLHANRCPRRSKTRSIAMILDRIDPKSSCASGPILTFASLFGGLFCEC